MNCTVCGAAIGRGRTGCAVCGFGVAGGDSRRWDRAVEAQAYEDLKPLLAEDESLLGFTRGRIAGRWPRKTVQQPQALLTSFVNAALTGKRLILQPLQPVQGTALHGAGVSIPLSSVLSMTVSDADPIESGRTTRLVITLMTGESFRLRASGRLAASALELVDVWRSIAAAAATTDAPKLECPACRRPLDRPHRFCPFCGSKQGAA